MQNPCRFSIAASRSKLEAKTRRRRRECPVSPISAAARSCAPGGYGGEVTTKSVRSVPYCEQRNRSSVSGTRQSKKLGRTGKPIHRAARGGAPSLQRHPSTADTCPPPGAWSSCFGKRWWRAHAARTYGGVAARAPRRTICVPALRPIRVALGFPPVSAVTYCFARQQPQDGAAPSASQARPMALGRTA
jgi:hypothetical protein